MQILLEKTTFQEPNTFADDWDITYRVSQTGNTSFWEFPALQVPENIKTLWGVAQEELDFYDQEGYLVSITFEKFEIIGYSLSLSVPDF